MGKGNLAKKTKEERFKILKEGYEQGRFEEEYMKRKEKLNGNGESFSKLL